MKVVRSEMTQKKMAEKVFNTQILDEALANDAPVPDGIRNPFQVAPSKYRAISPRLFVRAVHLCHLGFMPEWIRNGHGQETEMLVSA